MLCTVVLIVISNIFSINSSDQRSWTYVLLTVMIIFFVIIGINIIIFFSSIVAFNANVIQFGLDQLHDSPTEHLVKYIHWYVLLSYVGTKFIEVPTSTLTSTCSIYEFKDFIWPVIVGFTSIFLLVAYLFLLISLCIAFCK